MDPGEYEGLVERIADRVHEWFRKAYGEKPHVRKTNDKAWVEQHSKNRIDIAALDYAHLPSDWQYERRIGSQIALDAVLGAGESNWKMDQDFIEAVSAELHARWLERNWSRAVEAQKSQYLNLSEEEKEKDRVFVRTAIEVWKNTFTAPPEQ